jgi:hypothetical protein
VAKRPRRNWPEESERIAAEEKKKADDMALYEEQTKRLTPIKKTNGYIRRRKTKSRWN